MVAIVKKNGKSTLALRNKWNDFVAKLHKWDFITELKTKNGVTIRMYVFYHLIEDKFYVTYLDKNFKDYWNIGNLTGRDIWWSLKTANFYEDTSIVKLYREDSDLIKILPM